MQRARLPRRVVVVAALRRLAASRGHVQQARHITPLFCSGVALVIYAVFLYGGRAKCCGLVDALEAKGQAKPGESAASVAPLLPEKEPPVEKI